MGARRLSAVLADFATTLNVGESVAGTLQQLVNKVQRDFAGSGVGAFVVDAGPHRGVTVATDDGLLTVLQLQVHTGSGPCLDAYRTGRPVSLDVPGNGSVFSFPMRAGGEAIGAVTVHFDGTPGFAGVALTEAQVVADVMGEYVVNVRNRHEVQEAVRRLGTEAMHDSLTGVPNRRLLQDRLHLAASKAHRNGSFVGVLFIDVDRLKLVNDSLGHDAGDELLRGVVGRMQAVLRPGDTLARLAGDEFVVVCEGMTDRRQAGEVAERVLTSLETPVEVAGIALRASVSIGIAFAGGGGGTALQALARADAAMYEAKRRGGGRATTDSGPGPQLHNGAVRPFR